MLGGNRDRVAEAEVEGFVSAVAPGRPFRLVGDEDHRLAGTAHALGEVTIAFGHAGARVDEEQHGVAIGERRLGLGAHAPRQRLAVARLQAGGVDDGEDEIAEPRFAFAAVAGDAGLVVDQRQLAADQPIEQRRLADVRAAR